MSSRDTGATSPERIRVLQSTDPEASSLVSAGWSISARSFGARLFVDVDLRAATVGRLTSLVARAQDQGATIVELDPRWAERLAAFDAATAPDYPSDSPATRRTPLDVDGFYRLWRQEGTRVFGAVVDSELVGATLVYAVAAGVVETEFTAVLPAHRGLGIGSAVKAQSIVGCLERGVIEFQTGGSMANADIRRSNELVGYLETEEWWTLVHP